ncbi:MAG: AraC family transcriptional regulator [Mesorhizobium sp.]|nr:AraC family transcriptional regulator [Mesorhizobium sp.]
MQGDWIEDIGASSGAATEQAACPQASGTFWQSSGIISQQLRYGAHLMPGLHIGCGITPGIRSEAKFGEMAASGSGATLVICRDPTHMTTTTEAGQFHASGVSISFEALRRYQPIARFADARGELCLNLTNVPKDVIARLAAPIDPWFQGVGRDLVREARAIELIAILEQALGDRLASGSIGARGRPLAMMAKDIIESEFATPITIEGLATRLSCSSRTLTTAFRQTFDLSVGAYVTRHRLTIGARLLRDGVRSTEVAYRIGYTPTHFATVFKRHYGVSPGGWRG